MFLSAKIAGNRDTRQGSFEFKAQNVPNIMGLILLTIIVTLHGVVKLMINSIFPNWKPRRMNHTHICLSVSTVRVLMLPTLYNVHSGNTISTRSGTPKNMLNSRKPGEHQSVQT